VVAKIIDLTGQKFGKLLVLKDTGKRKHGGSYWLCQCECGRQKEIKGASLRQGHTQSCSCKRRFVAGEAAFNRVYKSYLDGAKKRELNFSLSKDDIKILTKGNCFYCGAPPSQIRIGNRINGGYVYNGIDRLDNNRGYTTENTVSCCGICNLAKRKMTVQEFIVWIKRIHKYCEERNFLELLND
jgi:hypothetical protein